MSAQLDNLLPKAAPRYGQSEPSAEAGLLVDWLQKLEAGNPDALLEVPAWNEGAKQPLYLVAVDLFATPHGRGDGFAKVFVQLLGLALKSSDLQVRMVAGALAATMGREYAETHAADLEVQ